MEESARELEQQQRFLSKDMHVLLVCEDDEPGLRDLLCDSGYQVSVESARTAAHRVARAKQQSWRAIPGSPSKSSASPDLVILLAKQQQNTCLPHTPQPQDFSLLHSLAPRLPPVVLAVEQEAATQGLVLRALTEGAADVLTLPLRRQEACMLWQHVYKSQLSMR